MGKLTLELNEEDTVYDIPPHLRSMSSITEAWQTGVLDTKEYYSKFTNVKTKRCCCVWLPGLVVQ